MSKKRQVDFVINLARTKRRFTTQDIVGIGITQQNARIYDARVQFGCIHGDRDLFHKDDDCKATEHIINVKANHYEYVNDKEPKTFEEFRPEMRKPLSTNLSEFDIKARITLVDAKLMVEKDPNRKKILELQKRGYLRALPTKFTKEVQEALS